MSCRAVGLVSTVAAPLEPWQTDAGGNVHGGMIGGGGEGEVVTKKGGDKERKIKVRTCDCRHGPQTNAPRVVGKTKVAANDVFQEPRGLGFGQGMYHFTLG